MKEEGKYKCNKCGKFFDESISESEQDYPGGHVSLIYLSPCYGAGYRDEW